MPLQMTDQPQTNISIKQQENHQNDDIEDILNEANKRFTKDVKNQRGTKFQQIDKVSNLNAIKSFLEPLRNKILAKIDVSEKKAEKIEGMPTAVEAQALANSLRAQFPLLRVDLIVRALHDMLHRDCQKRQLTEQRIPYQPTSEGQFQSLADFSMINSSVRAKQYVNMPLDPRFSDEKRIAISFLNFGYGVRILRDYIQDPTMNATKYNNIVTTVMKLTFRQLQKFIKNLGKAIVAINSNEERMMRAPLTNAQKWMPPDELEAFYRFLKYSCKLDQKLQVQPSVAVRLYNSCIRQLQQRQQKEEEERKEKRVKGLEKHQRMNQRADQQFQLFNHKQKKQKKARNTVDQSMTKHESKKQFESPLGSFPIFPQQKTRFAL